MQDPNYDGPVSGGAGEGMQYRKASNGTWFIYRALTGHEHAGTGTREELLELEKHLRLMLTTKNITYNYIESQLMSYGYDQRQIRKLFNKLTGIPVEELGLRNLEALHTPPSIPKFNLGWGKAKSGDFDYYYVMPWLLGHSVFGQKGDTHREVAYSTDSLEDARKWCEKHTSDYQEYNKSIDGLKVTKTIDHNLNEPADVGVKTSSLSDSGASLLGFLSEFGTDKGFTDKLAFVKSAYASQEITEADYRIIEAQLRRQADVPNVTTVEQETIDKSIADQFRNAETAGDSVSLTDEMREATPQDFFDTAVRETTDAELASVVGAIEDYFRRKTEEVSGKYDVLIERFKYIRTPIPDGVEETVDVNGKKPIEYLKSSGVASIVFSARPVDDMTTVKYGLMTLAVRSGNFETLGTFKGAEGETRYALSTEGLDKYFGADK